MPWFGLQCVIVVFPDHTHLPFAVTIMLELLRSQHGFVNSIVPPSYM